MSYGSALESSLRLVRKTIPRAPSAVGRCINIPAELSAKTQFSFLLVYIQINKLCFTVNSNGISELFQEDLHPLAVAGIFYKELQMVLITNKQHDGRISGRYGLISSRYYATYLGILHSQRSLLDYSCFHERYGIACSRITATQSVLKCRKTPARDEFVSSTKC